MKIQKLADDPRFAEVAKRLGELQAEFDGLETRLKCLRHPRDHAAEFQKQAEDLAAGIEPAEPIESHEEAIQRLLGRRNLVEAAIGAQRRKLAETRQIVADELLQGLRPQYTKHISDVAARVQALCEALAKHDDFVNAVAAAGLPACDHLPAGGIWRRPRVLTDFGASVDQDGSIAKEFFAVLASCGYGPIRKEAVSV